MQATVPQAVVPYRAATWLGAALRMLFVVLVGYPVVRLWLGMRVRHPERLPTTGPAIVVANHNSHLDMLALLTLFPLRRVPRVQPAAASDYFFRTWWRRWFATHVIGIIPVRRGSLAPGAPACADPLEACYQALAAGQVLVVFPEGTRGQPEHLAALKAGVWYLARRFPEVPVVPVFLHGLGRAMPKGRLLPLPCRVRVAVGTPVEWGPDKAAFMGHLRQGLCQLRQLLHGSPGRG